MRLHVVGKGYTTEMVSSLAHSLLIGHTYIKKSRALLDMKVIADHR